MGGGPENLYPPRATLSCSGAMGEDGEPGNFEENPSSLRLPFQGEGRGSGERKWGVTDLTVCGSRIMRSQNPEGAVSRPPCLLP